MVSTQLRKMCDPHLYAVAQVYNNFPQRNLLLDSDSGVLLVLTSTMDGKDDQFN